MNISQNQTILTQLHLSIGLQLVPLPLLKIKEAADLAGLSPPQVQWKDLTSLKTKNYNHFLNNNWQTAPLHTEMKVAMVVLWMMPLNIAKNMVQNQRALILTKDLTIAVPTVNQKKYSPTLDSRMLPQKAIANLKLLLCNNLSLLPLKLIHSSSNYISEVSLPTVDVEPIWTTEFWLSVMEAKKIGQEPSIIISQSKTLGDLLGEKVDISKFWITEMDLVSVVFNYKPLILLLEKF